VLASGVEPRSGSGGRGRRLHAGQCGLQRGFLGVIE
jgi:hypothetical protein